MKYTTKIWIRKSLQNYFIVNPRNSRTNFIKEKGRSFFYRKACENYFMVLPSIIPEVLYQRQLIALMDWSLFLQHIYQWNPCLYQMVQIQSFTVITNCSIIFSLISNPFNCKWTIDLAVIKLWRQYQIFDSVLMTNRVKC